METSLFVVVSNVSYIISSVLFIIGIKMMAKPSTARRGNFYSAIGMLIAILVTLLDQKVLNYIEIFVAVLIGSVIGAIYAKKVKMTAMPQMVALFNGYGGLASFLVAISEHWRLINSPEFIQKGNIFSSDENIATVSVILSILIGGVTFTGSVAAWAKLDGLLTGKSVIFKGQHPLNLVLFLISIACGVGMFFFPENLMYLFILGLISLVLGVLVVIPIGGADMPVVICLLNSYSGMAACTTGFILSNTVLIITGALVGASGIILTNIMCKAMNRSIANVLLGGFGLTTSGSKSVSGKDQTVIKEINVEEAAMIFDGSSSVIIVPGYGMAVAQAQRVVKEFADILEENKCSVKYAIHPVAGRMPGHMNVLLAEANVPYDQLMEMDQINGDFETTDVALIIGANDVTNPAARHDKSSPIYGMPILNVDKARSVIVLKRSMNPGYAGVENELYGFPNCLMLFGDAKSSMGKLVTALKELQ